MKDSLGCLRDFVCFSWLTPEEILEYTPEHMYLDIITPQDLQDFAKICTTIPPPMFNQAVIQILLFRCVASLSSLFIDPRSLLSLKLKIKISAAVAYIVQRRSDSKAGSFLTAAAYTFFKQRRRL